MNYISEIQFIFSSAIFIFIVPKIVADFFSMTILTVYSSKYSVH